MDSCRSLAGTAGEDAAHSPSAPLSVSTHATAAPKKKRRPAAVRENTESRPTTQTVRSSPVTIESAP